MAILAGLHPRQVADLDEDEYDSLVGAVERRQREADWGNLHEAVAAAVEALWAILARLDAGIATISVAKTQRPADPGRFPRPDWVDETDDPDEIVVGSPAEALRLMRRSEEVA